MSKIATTCINCVYDTQENLKKYFKYIDEAAAQGAELIVFPEQSLQGYLPSLTELQLESLDYQYKNAEVVPDGPSTQKIISKAKEKSVYIIYGMTERDADRFDVLYNTMVLVGPEGFVGKYRKVHLPLDEMHIYYPGNDFPVFETSIGRIGMLICYDKAFPESAREMALKGAEILVMSTAWPFEDAESQDLKTDRMKFLYDLYDQARAAENQCFFVSSNQYGKTGSITYLGCSQITSPSGEILVSTGNKEGFVIADVDIKGDIIKGRTRGFLGLNLLKDRKPDVYRSFLEGSKYPF
ncbi:carbon-nitrogen hydrolase family protein [Thermoanaerobacterium thermosaccharolyticum]|uniref:carbon-nitrogen hydrolase family protein n=1 Tax=Thermoanaerobacterium thermosaccharolyticum TaxID=1517 RepID=UPI003DA9771E